MAREVRISLRSSFPSVSPRAHAIVHPLLGVDPTPCEQLIPALLRLLPSYRRYTVVVVIVEVFLISRRERLSVTYFRVTSCHPTVGPRLVPPGVHHPLGKAERPKGQALRPVFSLLLSLLSSTDARFSMKRRPHANAPFFCTSSSFRSFFSAISRVSMSLFYPIC